MEKNSCALSCSCKTSIHKTQFVVLTGGPGAGKTAVLEYIRKLLCSHVVVLPEAASILFGGGFWRLKSNTAIKAAQRAIFHVQKEIQNLVIDEEKWAVGLCDRGTLDGLAYWPGTEKEYFEPLNTDLQKEFKKYKAVIHLKSPGMENGYNNENPIRTESAEQALVVDKKIHAIWSQHSNYFSVESTIDFKEKLDKAVKLIQLQIPDCCRSPL